MQHHIKLHLKITRVESTPLLQLSSHWLWYWIVLHCNRVSSFLVTHFILMTIFQVSSGCVLVVKLKCTKGWKNGLQTAEFFHLRATLQITVTSVSLSVA